MRCAVATLLSLISLAAAGSLAPRADTGPQFNLTALGATLPELGEPFGSGPIPSSIGVNLDYPDPSSGATLTTSCSYSWPASPGPGPTNWTPCTDPAVSWRLPADGYTSETNFRVEFFQTLTLSGSGLDATHVLDFNPTSTDDPNAYLSCIQMGKTAPLTCQMPGPLAQHPPPVVMHATAESERPS